MVGHAVRSRCCILCCLMLTLLLVLLGMNALVLFEILGALESFAADVAVVWLEGGMDANMGGDMITLSTTDVTAFPFAREAEVVGGLATDMVVAEVLVHDLGVVEDLAAVVPSTSDWLCGLLKFGAFIASTAHLGRW